MLTAILKFWCFLVFIEVALRVDNSVSLLEMVWTFFADPISVMREGSNSSIGGTGLSFCYKFEDSLVFHLNQ